MENNIFKSHYLGDYWDEYAINCDPRDITLAILPPFLESIMSLAIREELERMN